MNKTFHINEINKEVAILEQCPAFKLLLKMYSKKVERTITPKDFIEDLREFEVFDYFYLETSLEGKLPFTIDQSITPKARKLIEDFKRRYWCQLKNSEVYYTKVRDKIYWERVNDPEMQEKIKADMRKFLVAYHMVKSVFENIEREWIIPWQEKPERYFNHLTWTMNIVLNELPWATIESVIIALLHDSIEDIKWINEETLKSIFWEYIAKWVKSLSKQDLEEFYLSKCDLERLETATKDERDKIMSEAKLKRQEHYFWHLDSLDDVVLTVKFADRIHNLRTLEWKSKKQILKKITETEKYFIPVAKKRNMAAYVLIMKELEKLRSFLWMKHSEK